MPEHEQNETVDQAVRAEGSSVSLLPDPGFLWQVFRRNFMLFSLVFVAICSMVAAYLTLVTPAYQAQASLLIEPTADPVRTSQPGVRQAIVNADQVDTEIRLIGSPIVSELAAQLYAERFASPDGDAFQQEEIASLSGLIRGSIFVSRSGQTRVVDITARGSDPVFTAAAANLVAEAYLQAQVQSKTQTSELSQEFLTARLSELEANALAAQAALDNYRAARGLVSGGGGTNAEQEVSNLNQQLAMARADLAEKQGRYSAAREQLARGSGGADVGAALGSGTISSLRQQEARASAELAVLTQRYGPMHPERQQTEEELGDIRQRIQEEINRVLSNLQADVQTAQSRVASLQASRGGALGAVSVSARAQTQLNELQQKADAAQAVYGAFLSRSQETAALRDSALPDASIASRATVPQRPVSPNVPLVMFFGLFFALGAGLFAILMAEYLRRGIQTKRDVEKQLRLRYAGAVPSLKSVLRKRRVEEAPHDYVLNHPHSLFAEAFRSIRTFLTLSPGKRPRAIAITSALPREGKTTTSVCLARTTAAEGIRTVLVDADLRRRGTSELLDYESQFDIYDYLAGTAPLSSCLHKDEGSGLDLLGSTAFQDKAQVAITEERVGKILDELRSLYDVIIIDTAPILGVAESRVWAMASDRVLLISHWKKTSIRAVEAVVSMLLDAGAKITGMAITQVDIRKFASTGDGDVYAYTKKFRGYYSD